MKCAYQKAVGFTPPSDGCVDCCKLETEFFGPEYDCNRCQITCGFLCQSNRFWDIPRCCGTKFGKYCGHYVWVSGSGHESFSRLVTLILEYATYEPYLAIPVEKKVTLFIGPDYMPTTKENAIGQVEAMIELGDDPKSLIPSYGAVPNAMPKSIPLNRRPMERRDVIDMQRLRLRQDALAPSLNRP